jgi:hypothetical protein
MLIYKFASKIILFQKAFVITMNTKLMKNFQNPPSFDNIMNEDFGMVNELSLLASNIQKEVYVVLNSFLYF